MEKITKNGVTRFCSKHGLDKWLRLGYKVVKAPVKPKVKDNDK